MGLLLYHFCTAPGPEAASAQAVIFQQTHLSWKVFFLITHLVIWFPSLTPLYFLISDMPFVPETLLPNAGMRGSSTSRAGMQQCWRQHSSAEDIPCSQGTPAWGSLVGSLVTLLRKSHRYSRCCSPHLCTQVPMQKDLLCPSLSLYPSSL